jgi:outer membrane protein assembly factor BamE
VLKVKICPLVLTAAMAGALLTGCYNIPINQGNRIEQTAVDRLKTGMTREQVRYLLGAPVLQDPFDQSRWNYVYRYKTKTGDYMQRTIILNFKGDTLAQITGDTLSADLQESEKPAEEEDEVPIPE